MFTFGTEIIFYKGPDRVLTKLRKLYEDEARKRIEQCVAFVEKHRYNHHKRVGKLDWGREKVTAKMLCREIMGFDRHLDRLENAVKMPAFSLKDGVLKIEVKNSYDTWFNVVRARVLGCKSSMGKEDLARHCKKYGCTCDFWHGSGSTGTDPWVKVKR